MIWLLTIILTALSYPPVIRLLAIQQPYSKNIVISNLTLNLLVLLGLVGATSPWITKKLFPKAPKGSYIVIAVIMAILVILVLKVAGTPTRF